jgi:hypothetical protein
VRAIRRSVCVMVLVSSLVLRAFGDGAFEVLRCRW